MSRYEFEFPTSAYQEAVFDFVSDDRAGGHGFVNAVAGSGKTYSLMCATSLAGGSVHQFAFNAHIAKETGVKLKKLGLKASSSTIHSAGRACVAAHHEYAQHSSRRNWVNGSKYGDLVKAVFREILDDAKVGDWDCDPLLVEAVQEEYPLGDIRRVVDLVRGNLLDPRNDDGIYEIVSHHGMVFNPAIYDALPRITREVVMRGLFVTSEIDFTDMIWLPTVRKMRPQQYDWVFVDEAQDLNAAQFSLVRKCVRPGGRMLFVGDRSQAIYGFAGADCNSVTNIIEAMGAKELPLSVCYRCPVSHVKLAQRIVPQIEWAEGAKEGEVLSITEDKLSEMVAEGDLVLCRTNAPLLSTCYALISDGVPAKVRGRSIGDGLVKIVKDIQKKTSAFDRFLDGLGDWEKANIAKIDRQRGDNQGAKTAVHDKVSCLRVVYGASDADSYEGLTASINALFSDQREAVMLSTVHKAKGLEAKRVFILKPELMPHPMATKPWEIEQEMNLKYVATTRATDTLVFVHGGGEYPPRPEPPRPEMDDGEDAV